MLAKPQHQLIRNELSGAPVQLTNKRLLERPVHLRARPMRSNSGSLYAEIEYKVADDGRVRRSGAVGGDIPTWRTTAIRGRLENLKYRSRFEGGEPIETEGLVHVQPYRSGSLS